MNKNLESNPEHARIAMAAEERIRLGYALAESARVAETGVTTEGSHLTLVDDSNAAYSPQSTSPEAIPQAS